MGMEMEELTYPWSWVWDGHVMELGVTMGWTQPWNGQGHDGGHG